MPARRRVHICHVCTKVVMRLDAFKRHLRMHAREDEGWNCPVEGCSGQFRRARKPDLVKHVKIYHPTHPWANTAQVPEPQMILFAEKNTPKRSIKYTAKAISRDDQLLRDHHDHVPKGEIVEQVFLDQGEDQSLVDEHGVAIRHLQYLSEGATAEAAQIPNETANSGVSVLVSTIGADGTEQLSRRATFASSTDGAPGNSATTATTATPKGAQPDNSISRWAQSLSPPDSFEGFDVVGGETSSSCRAMGDDTYEVKTVKTVIYRRRP